MFGLAKKEKMERVEAKVSPAAAEKIKREIDYDKYVLAKIDAGLEDMKAGRGTPDEEMDDFFDELTS